VSCNSALAVTVDGLREMMFDNQLASLFATHPPIERRVEAIRACAESVKQREGRLSDAVTRPGVGVSTEERPSPKRAHVRGYYNVLARTMAGRPEMVDVRQREAIYRRARALLVERVGEIDPPLSESKAQSLQDGLEAAIAEVESRLSGSRLEREPRRPSLSGANRMRAVTTRGAPHRPPLPSLYNHRGMEDRQQHQPTARELQRAHPERILQPAPLRGITRTDS